MKLIIVESTEKEKEYEKKYYRNNKKKISEKSKIYYQNNKERVKAKESEWRKNNPEKKKLNDKKYREFHKDDAKKYSKKYNKINREKISQQRKEYRESHKDEIKIKTKENYWKTHTPFVSKHEQLGITKKEYKKLLDKQYAESHKEEIKIKQRENYLRNRKKRIAQAAQRRRAHPELKLQYDLKALTIFGFPLKLPPKQYKYALHAWSKTVKKLGHGLCQICPNTATVAHHIIHKAKYPGLSLNVNNGIPLCDTCHYEVHGYN